jgi:RNA polymerase sigma factor (sigma-70 family)
VADWRRVGDEELLAGAVTDADAFATFYLRHVDGVLAMLRAETGAPEVAFDVAAEAFAAALESVERFEARGDGSARAWLYGIARHKLIDSRRRGRVSDEVRRRLGMEPIALDDEAIERINLRIAAGSALEALELLPAEQAAAVRARHVHELGYEEIAESMRTSQSVIRQRVSRGLHALRDHLGEMSDEP